MAAIPYRTPCNGRMVPCAIAVWNLSSPHTAIFLVSLTLYSTLLGNTEHCFCQDNPSGRRRGIFKNQLLPEAGSNHAQRQPQQHSLLSDWTYVWFFFQPSVYPQVGSHIFATRSPCYPFTHSNSLLSASLSHNHPPSCSSVFRCSFSFLVSIISLWYWE